MKVVKKIKSFGLYIRRKLKPDNRPISEKTEEQVKMISDQRDRLVQEMKLLIQDNRMPDEGVLDLFNYFLDISIADRNLENKDIDYLLKRNIVHTRELHKLILLTRGNIVNEDTYEKVKQITD